MKRGFAIVAVLLAVLAEAAGAATARIDPDTQVISRQGASEWELWVIDRFTVPPPAASPPRPGPRVVLGGVRTTRAREGRLFRIELRLLTDTGAPPPRGPVRCLASVAGRAVRVRARGWLSGRPYCAWKLPRSSRGKRLRGVIRVNGLEQRFSRRISA